MNTQCFLQNGIGIRWQLRARFITRIDVSMQAPNAAIILMGIILTDNHAEERTERGLNWSRQGAGHNSVVRWVSTVLSVLPNRYDLKLRI